MWFLVLVAAVVVALVAVGIRTDLRQRRRRRMLADTDFATRQRGVGERSQYDALNRAEFEMRTRGNGGSSYGNFGGF